MKKNSTSSRLSRLEKRLRPRGYPTFRVTIVDFDDPDYQEPEGRVIKVGWPSSLAELVDLEGKLNGSQE